MNNEVCERCKEINGKQTLFLCANTQKCFTAFRLVCRCGTEFTVKQKDTKIDYKTNYTPNRNWDMLYTACPKCGEIHTVAFIPNEDDDRERLIAHNNMISHTITKNN